MEGTPGKVGIFDSLPELLDFTLFGTTCLHGCWWETCYTFAHCGLVVEILT